MNLINHIYQYIIKQILKWFFITLFVLLSIISFFEALELVRRMASLGYIPTVQLVEMVVLKWPSHINKLLPFITFLGVILGFIKLNQANEITAIRTIGVSVWQLARVSCLTVLSIGLLNLFVLGPMGAAMSKRLSFIEENLFKNRSSQKLFVHDSGLWFREVYPNGDSYIMHAKKLNLSQNRFGQVTYYLFNNQTKLIKRCRARAVTLEKPNWALEDVESYSSGNKIEHVKSLNVPTELSIDKVMHTLLEPSTLSFGELRDFIAILNRAGLSTRAYDMHWHKQLADIGFMISLTLLSMIFCLKTQRYHNQFVYLFYGVIISFVAYFADDIIYALGLSGRLPLLLSTWMVPLIIAMLSIHTLIQTEDHV